MQYITYRYLKQNNQHTGITAACDYNKDSKLVSVGFAFCSPKEKNFSKKRARQIAAGRMHNNRSKVTIKLENEESLAQAVFTRALKRYITKRICGNSRLPEWISKILNK